MRSATLHSTQLIVFRRSTRLHNGVVLMSVKLTVEPRRRDAQSNCLAARNVPGRRRLTRRRRPGNYWYAPAGALIGPAYRRGWRPARSPPAKSINRGRRAADRFGSIDDWRNNRVRATAEDRSLSRHCRQHVCRQWRLQEGRTDLSVEHRQPGTLYLNIFAL